MKPTKLLVSPYERFKDYPPNEFDYEDMLYDLNNIKELPNSCNTCKYAIMDYELAPYIRTLVCPYRFEIFYKDRRHPSCPLEDIIKEKGE